MGDPSYPLTLNHWNYVEGNPINYTDPTGLIKQSESVEADKIVKELKTYNAYVRVDWGEWRYWYNDPVDSNKSGIRCDWNDGEWYLNELIEIRKGVIDSARAMGFNNFIFNFGYINIIKEKLDDPKDIARGGLHVMKVNNNKHIINRWTTVHELGHVWDANFGWRLSKDLVTLTTQYGTNWGPSAICDLDNKLPGCNASGYVYYDVLAYGSGNTMNPREDFANSFAAYVYPEDSQTQIQKYETLNQGLYTDYLYYTDYRTTLRWRIIDALIRSTNSFRPR